MKFTEKFKLSTPPQSLPHFSFVGALFKCLCFPAEAQGLGTLHLLTGCTQGGDGLCC